jgi:hypothetical protein
MDSPERFTVVIVDWSPNFPIFQLLARYNYKHFASFYWSFCQIVLIINFWNLLAGAMHRQERNTVQSVLSILIFKGGRGCCCPTCLYFPSLYTLCCIGVLLNMRIFFCTVLFNHYFTVVIHLEIDLSFLQDKRVVKYLCNFIWKYYYFS